MAIWTPAEITGLLWIDPDDASTVTLNGSNVAQINDKFGGANYAAQVTASYQPGLTAYGLNGKSILTFATDKLTLASAIDFRNKFVCMVIRHTTAALGQIWSHSSVNNQFRFDITATGMTVAGGTPIWSNTIAAASAITFGAWSVIILDGNTTAGKLYVNGVLKDTGGAQSVAAWFNQLGARATSNEPLIGDIAEALIVANAVDRQQIEGYLHWRFGLESLLPADHPYKSAAPGITTISIMAMLDQAWGDNPIVSGDLTQPWGVKLGSDLHQPWTNAPQTRANLNQPWGSSIPQRANLTQPWGDASAARANLAQPWGSSIPQRAALTQPWGDASAARANLAQPWASSIPQSATLKQPWDDAAATRANLHQPWASSIPQRADLLQGWTIFGVILTELAQRWAISADLTRGELLQGWDLRERDLLHADLVQRWAIEADGTDVAGSGSDGVMRYQVAVQVGGTDVGVAQLNIEGGSDGDTLSCELQLGTEAEYLLCTIGAALAVSITSLDGTDDFVFVITDARIAEEHGKTTYEVEAESPGVLLGDSYADPVGGALSGMASAVAASLAGSVPLQWRTVDWEIPPATWNAAGDTPLALLKTLAAAVGAVVQSLPDGSLLVVPEYEAAVNLWSAAAPGVSLVENLDCFATGSDPDYKSGCNWYLIASQQTSTDTLRLEETEVDSTLKEVRGYQTPWTGAFALAHTGGDWVAIEPMGREDRQETETVEFVAGAGKVKYPIYAVESTQWQQTNLGSVALAEDGSLTAAVAAQSLLTITYTTRCLLWRVRDPNNEQLQLVVEL